MNRPDTLHALLNSGPKRIVISSHTNPDGDAIGSSLGLYHYLKTLGHELTVILPNEMPESYQWLPGFELIRIYEQHRDFCAQRLKAAELIFVLDYSALHRADEVGLLIGDNKQAYKFMVDHHLEPQPFYDDCLWRSSASSTCELVWELIRDLGGLDQMPKAGLYALYTGILTDTGGFRHAVSAPVFTACSDLVARGLDPNLASDMVFNNYSYRGFELLAFCLSERLQVVRELNTAIIAISRRDYEYWQIQKGDLEGIANMVLRMRPLRCAILLTERKTEIRLSMRSKGDFSVQQICSRYFEGGGHFNAAGGTSKTSLEETIDRLLFLLHEEFREGLQAPMTVEI